MHVEDTKLNGDIEDIVVANRIGLGVGIDVGILDLVR